MIYRYRHGEPFTWLKHAGLKMYASRAAFADAC
jgi:hypothetical protein